MATKSIAWADGSGDYITLTYTGQGNGSIVASSPENKGVDRSKTITIKTTQGGVVTKNVTINQAASIFPVGDVKNFSYTGSYQEVTLPAGQYKLQVWGAQGGKNGTNSTYGITAKDGGKGGYSEGILTLSSKTIVRVYVGGQGTTTTGGFNGGGTASGTSSYNSGGHFGISKFGGGGGATDIRLSDGSLYSRMIVAGGGSGGAMCYKSVTTTVTNWTVLDTVTTTPTRYYDSTSNYTTFYIARSIDVHNKTLKFTWSGTSATWKYHIDYYNGSSSASGADITPNTAFTSPNRSMTRFTFHIMFNGNVESIGSGTFTLYEGTTTTETTTDSTYANGYTGGGEVAGSYGTGFPGRQNEAGYGGSFGNGANQAQTNTRYVGAAGGGGWYGGGAAGSDSYIHYNRMSGGGSGWVNIYANRGNRPSGYTGLQLDSGTTYVGYGTAFPAPGGGTETGHAGNGYARITRLN